MIEKTAVLTAETTLFNSVLSGNLLRKSEDDISEIIKVYIQDAEVKNLMNVFNLTAGDFEIIYYHVFESLFFRDLLFVEDTREDAVSIYYKIFGGTNNGRMESCRFSEECHV